MDHSYSTQPIMYGMFSLKGLAAMRQVVFPKLQDVLVLRPLSHVMSRDGVSNPYMLPSHMEKLRKMMEFRKLCGSPNLRFHMWKKERR